MNLTRMRKVSMTLRLSRSLRTKPRLKSRLSAKKKLTAGKSNAMTAGIENRLR